MYRIVREGEKGRRVRLPEIGTRYIADATRQTSSNWGADAGSRYEDLTAFMEKPAELARELRSEGITGMKIWPFDAAAERTGGTDITAGEIGNGIRIVEAIREAVGRNHRGEEDRVPRGRLRGSRRGTG